MNRKIKMPDIDLSAVVSALNNKADVGLENSDKASVIEQLAQSGLNASEAALNVANAANTLIETSLPQKFDKTGGTIAGNTVVDGNLTVTGEINATITGSSESAISATKDSDGNIIVDTYLRKDDWLVDNDNTLQCTALEFKYAHQYNHGGYIDFHYGNSTTDFTSRIIEEQAGALGIYSNLYVNGSVNRRYNLCYNDAYTVLYYYEENTHYYLFGQRRNLSVSIQPGMEGGDLWTLPFSINGVLYATSLPLTAGNVGIIQNGVNWSSTNLEFRFLAYSASVNRVLNSYGFCVVAY